MAQIKKSSKEKKEKEKGKSIQSQNITIIQ